MSLVLIRYKKNREAIQNTIFNLTYENSVKTLCYEFIIGKCFTLRVFNSSYICLNVAQLANFRTLIFLIFIPKTVNLSDLSEFYMAYYQSLSKYLSKIKYIHYSLSLILKFEELQLNVSKQSLCKHLVLF